MAEKNGEPTPRRLAKVPHRRHAELPGAIREALKAQEGGV